MATLLCRIKVASTELAWARITERYGVDWTVNTIKLAVQLSTVTTAPALESDWKVPSMLANVSTSIRRAGLLIGPGAGGIALAKGEYSLWYRITANPEDIIREAGNFIVE